MTEQPSGITKKYIVEAVEEVLDAFDDFEHYNSRPPIEVEAQSVDDALNIGHRLHQDVIWKERREGGFMSSGTFTAYVTRILLGGDVLYEREPPERTWP